MRAQVRACAFLIALLAVAGAADAFRWPWAWRSVADDVQLEPTDNLQGSMPWTEQESYNLALIESAPAAVPEIVPARRILQQVSSSDSTSSAGGYGGYGGYGEYGGYYGGYSGTTSA